MSGYENAGRTVGAQGAPHMSPAQAAQVAGLSRWAVLRAIKSMKLNAIRDNRGNWRISPSDLADWCGAHSAHIVQDSAPAQDAAQGEAIATLREALAAAVARADVATMRADAAERARDEAESQRDHWRQMAEKLADKPHSWWPFSRK